MREEAARTIEKRNKENLYNRTVLAEICRYISSSPYADSLVVDLAYGTQ